MENHGNMSAVKSVGDRNPVTDVSEALGRACSLASRVEALTGKLVGEAPSLSENAKLASVGLGGVLGMLQTEASNTQDALTAAFSALDRLERHLG